MKNKIYILLICILLVSCAKKNPMEEVFYTDSNECWQYFSSTNFGYSYLKFNQNNTSDDVDIENGKFIIRNSRGHVLGKPRPWSVSNDSILTWGMNTFDIMSYNDKIIILYIEGNGTNNKITSDNIYLVKTTIENPRNGQGHYANKRVMHPEKYRKL